MDGGAWWATVPAVILFQQFLSWTSFILEFDMAFPLSIQRAVSKPRIPVSPTPNPPGMARSSSPAVCLLFHLASCPAALLFLWCSASVDIRAFARTVPSSRKPLSWAQGKSQLLRMMSITASLCLKECFSCTAPYQFPVYSLPRNHQISQSCIYLHIFFLVHWKGILPTLFSTA